MEQIGIESVLMKLNDTVDRETSAVKTFGIRFLSADGQREMHCRKFTKMPKATLTDHDRRGRQYYNLQESGTLLLEDVEAGHPKSVKAAMIYGFRDYQSSKWLNVFH